jgi:hypothetical protein
MLFILRHHYTLLKMSNMTGAFSGAGTAYPSGKRESTFFAMGFVLLNLFCAVFCQQYFVLLFVPFLLANVSPVLRFNSF